jgi:hypothetical protein
MKSREMKTAAPKGAAACVETCLPAALLTGKRPAFTTPHQRRRDARH